MFLRYYICRLGIFPTTEQLSVLQTETESRASVGRPQTDESPHPCSGKFMLAVLGQHFCFVSSVFLLFFFCLFVALPAINIQSALVISNSK